MAAATSSFNFRASEALGLLCYCNFWLGVKAQLKTNLEDCEHCLKWNPHTVVRLEPSRAPLSLELEPSLQTNLEWVHSPSPVRTEADTGTEPKGWVEKSLLNLCPYFLCRSNWIFNKVIKSGPEYKCSFQNRRKC